MTVISSFQLFWPQMKPTRFWLVQGSSLTNSAYRITKSCACSSPNPHYPLALPKPVLQTKFSTGTEDHIGDDYFLTSGDKIRYFLEEDAVDQQGNLTREKHRAVNKIGHGLSFTRLPPPCPQR